MADTIIRVKKDGDYAVISNEPLNDDRLSWEAKGVLAYLLTKPNNWEVRNHDLEKKGRIGGYKLSRILAELKQTGYLTRCRKKRADGTFAWETIVYEKSTIPRLPIDGSPIDGSPIDGKPRHIINTELKNTESLNTNKHSGATAAVAPCVFSFEGELDAQPKRETVQKGGTKDERIKDKRVAAVRAVMHLTPNDIQRGAICSQVTDQRLWGETLEWWALKGYSPRNIAGMIEVYTQGGPKSAKQNGNHNQSEAEPMAAEEY